MFVAAHSAMNTATRPMKRRIRPLKKPPTPYAISSTIGNRSIHVNWCFPRVARPSVRLTLPGSLAEPGAVSFLQSQPDVRDHGVHFSVRQGAPRASESQGECRALVTLGHLGSAIFVKRTSLLEEFPARLLDRQQDRARRDRLLDHHREVALHRGELRQRMRPRHTRGREHRLDVDLERDEARRDAQGHGRMNLSYVPELASV